ncbi:exodeoxyribonuclease V subunit gamma [Chitinimonas sp. BJB300]|uniref:exodeoxyribonuclease V subunit gamma n=1 Tax=Chitinimonas sp. BJB300 TaxID=1559339 RepID=UPI000C111300|nr:exodeoxyribonuclease V subunit gamma [Chitinimonas sp. BJB300]PHV12783.1 exodeoxyribonuclease V subunit gamma [Chitinimonas sp. BJB300]TSJ91348.1 exodeoxyribonuclease V subunit gamma [Chitinimonas sp. BJB300]
MLHLYQSNRLDTLASLLQGVLSVPPANVYARETIIVQARGMGRWLSLKIAEQFGVCANVDFPLPAGFLWQLIETVLGPQPRSGPFGSDALSWRLHVMLAEPPTGLAGYLSVHSPKSLVGGGAEGPQHEYLSERRRWRLATRIADVFDQYLVYRPDWLQSWEAGHALGLGQDEAWQMALWRKLALDRSSAHRADLMQSLIDRLHDPAPLDLPERIVLFGSSSLPPLLLQILQALAERIDVALFALNPSNAPWGDITSRADAQGVGERLLAAWGAQGRVFFDELAAVDALTNLFDETPPPASLLKQLQYDVLTLQARPALLLGSDDQSLAVHACHSPLRQVETLKDALLARLQADHSLQPADIVVLCPDIDSYSPYIDAVFGQGEPSLPYAVADKGGLAASPLLEGWLELLRLPDTDWEADRLAALLEMPALAASFGLEAEDLPLLHDWIAAAGIRRGRQGDAFSWQAGIGRLLLGVAMPSDVAPDGAVPQLPLFAGLVPVADLDLRFATQVAGLSRFVRTLSRWQDALSRPRSLVEWSQLLAGWLGRWFVESEADLPALDTLRAALVELGELAQRSGVDVPVGRVAVLEWLNTALQAGSSAGGFLTGGVTFAQLMPMRNLPFRVVAVLGLDDGRFPRDSQPDGFDLIARHPRRGDRARALDERWLFLETVLAAGESLLLFYTGRDVRSDVALPPSTVIADLLDAIDSGWCDATGQPAARRVVYTHTLQPFSPQQFAVDAVLPAFDPRWASVARLAGQGSGQPPNLASASLPAERIEDVALADLLAFACDASGWFLRRIGVRFARGEAALASREPFALDGPAQRALLQLAGDDADVVVNLALLGHGAALLPEGLAGEIWAERAAQQFGPALALWRQFGEQEYPVELKIEGLRLHGLLRGLDSTGLGLRHAGKLREADRIGAWLQHLVLCICQPAGIALQSRLIGLVERADYATPIDAQGLLADWLAAYRMTYQRPLPLLPRSGFAYAEGLNAKRDGGPERAMSNARKAWEGSPQQTGEGDFDSVRALWRGQAPFDDDFAAIAEQLLSPLLAHETRGKLA